MDTFDIKNEDIKERMNTLAKQISATLPEGWGFNLMIFDYGDHSEENPGAMFYISGTDWATAKPMLQEYIKNRDARGGE